jgi:hypothetical protein
MTVSVSSIFDPPINSYCAGAGRQRLLYHSISLLVSISCLIDRFGGGETDPAAIAFSCCSSNRFYYTGTNRTSLLYLTTYTQLAVLL